ncbi:MAG: T9SS type A sorting domain-containing protein [Ferruginibacter sp.]
MKKITFTLALFSTLSAITAPAFSTSLQNEAPFKFDNGKNKEMSIVSNRASGEAQVRFNSSKNGEAIITVLDEAGKVLLQQTSKLSSGVNNIGITKLLTLNEGTYTVRLTANNQTYSSRLLLWK